jgi:gamma-D-glutamyl-L-lysine dipeptidyl-peptidase
MRYRHNLLTQIFFAVALVVFLTNGSLGQIAGPDRVVVVPVANMYSATTEDSDVVSQAIIGSNVVTLDVRGNWARVRTDDQYTGWMLGDALRRLGESGAYGRSGQVVQVEGLFANLYSETDVTLHKPVVTVPFETRLEVVAEGKGNNSGWLQVRLPDQRIAWIQSGDINRDSQPLTIAQSIALAKRFLGLPYLWGGRSSYGYDCSGFTQMLVRSRGITMPRDADLQAAWEGVEAVDRKDLRAGDLLFFGSGVGKITHTAMYIGGGEFIHATTHDHPVVQISRLDDQPWTRILVACRRIK